MSKFDLLYRVLHSFATNSELRHKVRVLKADNAELQTKIAILKDELRHAKQKNNQLENEIKTLTHEDPLAEIEVQILIRLAALKNGERLRNTVARAFDLSDTRFDHAMDRLVKWQYIHQDLYDRTTGGHYSLTEKARTFLIAKGLA
jgi:septation ring formation regulator EzrA